jgi:hypothetical protein
MYGVRVRILECIPSLVRQLPSDVVCDKDRVCGMRLSVWGKRDGVRAVADVHPASGTRRNLRVRIGRV